MNCVPLAGTCGCHPSTSCCGTRATETAIKSLSSSGKLAQYRVLHFATHGTIAGEIESTSEPGLILTPPKEQSEEDDGYLSASEVAALKLLPAHGCIAIPDSDTFSREAAQEGLACPFVRSGEVTRRGQR